MQSTQNLPQHPPLFKAISRNKLCLRLCIAMPCIILWALIVFIYSSFNIIYVFPLISNTYWYDNNPNSQLTIEEFPAFKHILSFESNLNLFSSNEHHKKGWVIFAILHYLLFWLLISIIRTMMTDPGQTPHSESQWAVKIESLANFHLEAAIKILKKNKIAEKRGLMKKRSLNTINELNPQNNDQTPIHERTKKMLSEPSRLMMVDSEQIMEKNADTEFGPLIYHSNSSEILSEEFTEKESEEMNKVALEIVMSKDFFRYCGFCKSFKPLRTHHCQQCMRCVLKMDHHCQWVLTCIGLRNYKFFMNMIIYGNLTLFFFLLTFTDCVIDVALNPYIDGFVIFATLFAYILGIVLFLIVLVFTGFHVWLIYRGKTTLEYFEKDREKEKSDKNNKPKKKKGRINFDCGKINNFVAVFNRNPLFWFFPVNPNESVDGLYQEFEDKIIEEQTK